jgi:hypothetical protein
MLSVSELCGLLQYAAKKSSLELGETERNKGQLYKWRAYNQAVNSLKVHAKRIESGAEAKSTPFPALPALHRQPNFLSQSYLVLESKLRRKYKKSWTLASSSGCRLTRQIHCWRP